MNVSIVGCLWWPQSCPFKAPCWDASHWLTASSCCPSWLPTTEHNGGTRAGPSLPMETPLTASLCPGAPHLPGLGFLSTTPSKASSRSAFKGVQLHLDLRLSCLLLLLIPLIIPHKWLPPTKSLARLLSWGPLLRGPGLVSNLSKTVKWEPGSEALLPARHPPSSGRRGAPAQHTFSLLMLGTGEYNLWPVLLCFHRFFFAVSPHFSLLFLHLLLDN